MAEEEVMGPRGKRLFYSRFFSGGIYRADEKHLDEFKHNCSRKNLNMNYNGEKNECGWLTLLKRNNKIEDMLIPIAYACKSNTDVFINELLNEFLENIKVECEKSGVIEEIDSFRKDSINKTVSGVTRRLQVVAMNRQ